MKTVSLKVKLILVALLSLICFTGVCLGTNGTAHAETVKEQESAMSIVGTSFFLSDEEDPERDMNGVRFALKVSSATFNKITTGKLKAGVVAYPKRLKPAGFNPEDPLTYTKKNDPDYPIVVSEFENDAWTEINGDRVAYLVIYNIDPAYFQEEFVVFGYYKDGNNLHITDTVSETMENAAGNFVAEHRNSEDPTVKSAFKLVCDNYATMFHVSFYDNGLVAEGDVSSVEPAYIILPESQWSFGWFSGKDNARTKVTKDTDFTCSQCNLSYDEEGGEWYDTLGTKVFLGHDAKGKTAVVSFDMLVETTCTDFALLDLTNGVKALDTALITDDYDDYYVTYTSVFSVNARGEIILAIGDWHDDPQRVTAWFTNFEYEVVDTATRSLSTNGYGSDFIIIPTDKPTGSLMSGSIKIRADKFKDAYVETTIKAPSELYSNFTVENSATLVSYGDISDGWTTVNFEAVVQDWTKIRDINGGNANVIALTGNNVIINVGSIYKDCETTVYKDVEMTRLYGKGRVSKEPSEGYGSFFYAIPAPVGAKTGDRYEITVDIKADRYSNQYCTPYLYTVDAIFSSIAVKTNILSVKLGEVTGDWQTVTFTGTVLNATSVKDRTDASLVTLSGKYILVGLGMTKTSECPFGLAVKDPKSTVLSSTRIASRSCQTVDDYGSDFIFVPVEGEGVYDVSMNIKAPKYSDAQEFTLISYVTEIWGNGSVEELTNITTHAEITGDWQEISFTAPSIQSIEGIVRHTSTSNAVEAPTGYFILVKVGPIKGSSAFITEYKDVSVTDATKPASRSYQTNDKYGTDFIIIPVEQEGNYTITMEIRAYSFVDQQGILPSNTVKFVKAISAANVPSSAGQIMAHNLIKGTWQTVTFTAPALSGSIIRHSATANAIKIEDSYFVLVSNGYIKEGKTSLTQYRNVRVTPAE